MVRLSHALQKIDFSPSKKKEIIDLVKSRDDLLAFFLFGSYHTPFFTPLSDIDFALLPMPGRTLQWKEEVEIMSECFRIVGSDDVNLVNLRKVPLSLTMKVLQGGTLLFCRDRTLLADFVERVIKLYGDWVVDMARIHQDFDHGLREEFIGGR